MWSLPASIKLKLCSLETMDADRHYGSFLGNLGDRSCAACRTLGLTRLT